MQRRILASIGCAAIVGLAGPAWAVVVEFNVRDATGAPVPGATIRLSGQASSDAGAAEAVATDETGRARLDIMAEIGTRTEVIVTYVNPGNGATMSVTRRITVDSGRPVDVTLALGGPAGLARGLGGGLVGAAFGRQVFENTTLQAQRFSDVRRVSNTEVFNEGGPRNADSLAELNRKEEKDQRVGLSAGARVVIPLDFLTGARGRSRPMRWGSFGQPASRTDTADGGAATPSGGGSGGWRVHPALQIGAARTDVTVDSRGLDPTVLTQAFVGEGSIWSIGANAVVFPCRTCGWFVAGGYQYSSTGDLDLMRRPALQSTIELPGIVVTRDTATYRFRSHAVRGTIGHAFRQVAPYAGVRHVRWRSTLDLDTVADFSQRFGVPADQAVAFENRFGEDFVEALAGVDVLIPRTPLVLRLEGAGNGDNYSFTTGIGVGFRR